MFPTLKVRLRGLDPRSQYIVYMDLIPYDDKRYRYVYHSSQWMVAGAGAPPASIAEVSSERKKFQSVSLLAMATPRCR